MPAPHSSVDTPVMRQYLELKAQHPDAILFFRMGDFYEMFFEDAVCVAPVLDIALTSRDRDAVDGVPMAGVPWHAIGGYLRVLVERGFKVAICEQMESPEEARKRKGNTIVRREVVRVVTPGTLLDDEHLVRGEPNYLAGVVQVGERFAVAALDISTSDFLVVDAPDLDAVRNELARLAPREIVTTTGLVAPLGRALGPNLPLIEGKSELPGALVQRRVLTLHEEGGAPRSLSEAALGAAALVVGAAESTQPGQTLLVHRLRQQDAGGHLVLDDASLRNLEIFKTLREGKREGSLLAVIDHTRTAMGARLLREWLGAPLVDLPSISRRHVAVTTLLAESRLRASLQSRLADVRDISRLAARARLRTSNPRELGTLRDSLAALPALSSTLRELAARRIGDAEGGALLDLGDDLLQDLHAVLADALVDAPPVLAREGGIIREGADEELDEQRALRDGGRDALAQIELRERQRTGIANLKVQHNRVFGYFIEVSRANLARVPSDYVRKQTTVSAERFVTEELAGLEARVLGAQATALSREITLFEALRDQVGAAGERLVDVATRLASIDVVCGFAEVAERQRWVRPAMAEAPVLNVSEGRHPVVEAMLPRGRFVPNDVALRAQGGGETPRMLLLTGPNMGGKSTYMRQVALATVLAHAGSFVPASTATIGLVDRVFTRVGAADDLGRGDSTFMVEMRETASILAHATSRSLVLLDEIGRGTATFDGLALAWAIAEHLHDQVGCRTLFATHYHELCALDARLPGVANAHVAALEERGSIAFLHKVLPGPAGKSYGIQVGRLAGLPARVLRRAARILQRLEEQQQSGAGAQLDLFAGGGVLPDRDPSREGEVGDGAGTDRTLLGPATGWSSGWPEVGPPRPRSGHPEVPPGVHAANAWHPGSAARAAEGEVAGASEAARRVALRLAAIELDDLSPREAHRVLGELVSMLQAGSSNDEA